MDVLADSVFYDISQFGIQLDGSRSARSGSVLNSLFVDVQGAGARGTALSLKLSARAKLSGGSFTGNWRDIDTDSSSSRSAVH